MAYNILIVDDSRIIRAVIIKTLGLAGIPVNDIHQAGDGKEALAILDDKWIDLIFADLNMPVMTGMEMVEKMNEDGLLKTIPVIVVSTEGSKTRIEELKARGIRGYIRKPFTPELVKEVVERVMEGG